MTRAVERQDAVVPDARWFEAADRQVLCQGIGDSGKLDGLGPESRRRPGNSRPEHAWTHSQPHKTERSNRVVPSAGAGPPCIHYQQASVQYSEPDRQPGHDNTKSGTVSTKLLTPTGDSEKILRMAPGDLDQRTRLDRRGAGTPIDQSIQLVYRELRRLAAAYLRGQSPGQTLQPTSLVHEAYLRLVEHSKWDRDDKVQFFRLAAVVMRQILVDHARAKLADKRGGGRARVELRDELLYSDEKAADLVALHDALKSLAMYDERQARILELRYFGGLSAEETAETLSLSIATIGRESRCATAWLRRELQLNKQRKPAR